MAWFNEEDPHVCRDDLVSNLVERNAINLNGSLTIAGRRGLAVSAVQVNLRDQRKGKDLLNVMIPVAADVRVGEVVLQIPRIP
jgi:hypothetical protein